MLYNNYFRNTIDKCSHTGHKLANGRFSQAREKLKDNNVQMTSNLFQQAYYKMTLTPASGMSHMYPNTTDIGIVKFEFYSDNEALTNYTYTREYL